MRFPSCEVSGQEEALLDVPQLNWKRFMYETENLGPGEKFSERKPRKLPLTDLGWSEEMRLPCSLLGDRWSLNAFTLRFPSCEVSGQEEALLDVPQLDWKKIYA